MMDWYLRGYLSGTLLCPSICVTVACQTLCLGSSPVRVCATVAGGHFGSGCFIAPHLQHPLPLKPPALRNPLIFLLITQHRQPGQVPHLLAWALLAFVVKGSPEPFLPWDHSYILSPLQTAASIIWGWELTQRAPSCPFHVHTRPLVANCLQHRHLDTSAGVLLASEPNSAYMCVNTHTQALIYSYTHVCTNTHRYTHTHKGSSPPPT